LEPKKPILLVFRLRRYSWRTSRPSHQPTRCSKDQTIDIGNQAIMLKVERYVGFISWTTQI